jgi:hypothetical protein
MRAKYLRAQRQNIRESQDAMYAAIVKEQRERQEREQRQTVERESER